MINLLLGLIIGLSLYISIQYSIMRLENILFTFKYRNMQRFGEEFAFIIDNAIINK